MIVPVDPGGTAVTGRPSTATNRAPVRVRVGSGPKSIVRLETAEEVSGVQLTTPAESGTDALLRMIPAALAQPTPQVTLPPRGRAAGIRGSVLSAARKPIAGASVRVVGSGVDQVVRTDKAGAFSLIGLTAGRYTLEATANGYMSWNYGQQGPRQPGRPIAVATDQIVENVEIVLPAGRVVSGVIVDEHGEPVHGAQVQALQLDYIAGRMTAVQVALERPTDDRGRYRIWGLQPGSYLVAASLHGLIPSAKGQPTEYATLYFPGTPTVASALPIDVREDATANLTFTPLGLTEVRGLARDGNVPLVSGTARLMESRRIGRRLRCAAFDDCRDGRLVHLPQCSARGIRRAGARRRPGPDRSLRSGGTARRHRAGAADNEHLVRDEHRRQHSVRRRDGIRREQGPSALAPSHSTTGRANRRHASS